MSEERREGPIDSSDPATSSSGRDPDSPSAPPTYDEAQDRQPTLPARTKKLSRLWRRRVNGFATIFILFPATLSLWIWCLGILEYSPLLPDLLRKPLVWLYLFVPPLAFVVLPRKKRTLFLFGVLSTAIFAAWVLFLSPSNDRDWIPLHARLPHATREGNLVTIYNIRNFTYETEERYTPGYYDRTFDLNKLKSLDFALSHWLRGGQIAHFLLSFGFEGGDYLCVSGEVRLEQGENYNEIGGFFKEFEFILILGDERDLIGRRAVISKNQVYLYPVRVELDSLRATFLEVVKRVNKRKEVPIFYNTITHNCTTSILPLIRTARGKIRWDIRILLNGYGDELAYERGSILTEDSFEETKRRHHINQYLEGAEIGDDFSLRIRPHLRK